MKGYIHSLQSLGTVDGPGVRAVIFTEGCPLRCIYCHNPDTWHPQESDLMESQTLSEKILRLYPFIKNGGVTFSGGEPCLQAPFLCEVAEQLKEKGLHIALDTCGEVYNADVDRLLSNTDLVLLDLKFTTEEDYRNYTGGSLLKVLSFLDMLESIHKETWIRHVVVPGINDTEEDIRALAGIAKGYSVISKIELLPFKNLCLEKYKELNIPFKLEYTPQMDKAKLEYLEEVLRNEL